MTNKIRVLPDHTINQIAAGEVIENPASAVKELVENALDAGADDITVEIQGGGRQLIRVTDNGCGMGPDDALLCLERHATSKIQKVEDIAAIHTMGFRGEALPSIASISKLMLLTKGDGGDEGTMVVIDGGRIVQCCPAARARGTTIEVKALFFNVPVRKRFQRSPKQDSLDIQRILQHIALVHPALRLRFIADQVEVFHAPRLPDGDYLAALEQRCASVLGKDFLPQALPVRHHSPYGTFTGLVAPPLYTRANRTGQILFINNRVVQAPAISVAVREGFGTRIDTRRHPLFILKLDLDGESVDVNVHPQKREVRLRQEWELRDSLRRGIDEALQKGGIATHIEEAPPPPTPAPMQDLSWAQQASIALRDEGPSLRDWGKIREPDPAPAPQMEQAELAFDSGPELRSAPRVMGTLEGYFLVHGGELRSYINPTGTVDRETPGLVLIDQHLAHSRVLFEKMLERQKEQDSSSLPFQNLLMPVTVDLPARSCRALLGARRELQSLGLNVEDFGADTVAISAVAPYLKGDQVEELLKEALELILSQPRKQGIEEERMKNLALAASRRALSSSKRMEVVEAQSLTRQLFDCAAPFQCPLGRPTMAHLSREHIGQLFTASRS